MITSADGKVVLHDEPLECPAVDIFPKLAESINSAFAPSITAKAEDGNLILSSDGKEAIFESDGHISGSSARPALP